MEKAEVSMGIDPFLTIRKALAKAKKRMKVKKAVSLSYDEEADILYVKFNYSKIVDHKPLDNDGLVMASLDGKGRVTGLIIMEASAL
ncbi:MAG: DUF2283 domain-containing protein [Nitrososphaerales archaeon]